MRSLVIALILVFATVASSAQALSSQIKNIQVFGKNSGIAYTRDSLYRTDDKGRSWTEIELTLRSTQAIAQVYFTSASDGWVLLAGTSETGLELLETRDMGATWASREIAIEPNEFEGAHLENASLILTPLSPRWSLHVPLETGSNFRGSLIFASDDRLSWDLVSRRVELNRETEAALEVRSGRWTLKTIGTCHGYKSGCVQETTIVANGSDITPPQIKALSLAERQIAKTEAVPMFALPPGGTTRISINKGFDKCTAFSPAQAQTWWNASPYYDVNIYMSGRNRACPNQPFNGNPAWLDQVTALGWGLIPTIVGYQSPCTASMTTVKLSYDPVIAEQQGRGEAVIAVTDANNIGLTTGSILYYDMERYDPPNPDTLGCRAATVAFLKGWTEQIHELGYISGVYGSPKNAQEDWMNMPAASKMDVVWLANWDNRPTVWFYNSFPSFPTSVWTNHQRIKQYANVPNPGETWGGVTFSIDRNILDAPVAAPTIARNRNADFDGDRKTDFSVFRPDTGVWYVLQSSNGVPTAVTFGLTTDILAPGDYDGDGKTDQAVFRPSDGSWHILTKAGFYSTRPFGTSGDIPVAADYNGDRKTDIAVFRPSDGVWYIANSDSQGTYSYIQFGLAGDKPVPADYDNDGRADVGVYRLNNGNQEWWIQRTTDGFLATVFGTANDNAVQADYTGDGRADIAFWRPADGYWYILRSEDFSYYAFPFGQNGDIPSTGDYDGDNKFDAAVFRPSIGTWFAQLSLGGYSIAQFGQNGDRSIPNSYLPQ